MVEQRTENPRVVGSIPIRVARLCLNQSFGIIAQLGEHLPYKQRVIGSSPIGPTFKFNNYAVVAQLAEQLICNQQVTGSSPVNGFTPGHNYVMI